MTKQDNTQCLAKIMLWTVVVPYLILSLITNATADTLVSVDAELFDSEVYAIYNVRNKLPTGLTLGAKVVDNPYGTEATPTIGYLWEPNTNYMLEVTLDKDSLHVEMDARF